MTTDAARDAALREEGRAQERADLLAFIQAKDPSGYYATLVAFIGRGFHEGCRNAPPGKTYPEPTRDASRGSAPVADSRANGEWLRAHAAEHEGNWVALKDGELVAKHKSRRALTHWLRADGRLEGVFLVPLFDIQPLPESPLLKLEPAAPQDAPGRLEPHDWISQHAPGVEQRTFCSRCGADLADEEADRWCKPTRAARGETGTPAAPQGSPLPGKKKPCSLACKNVCPPPAHLWKQAAGSRDEYHRLLVLHGYAYAQPRNPPEGGALEGAVEAVEKAACADGSCFFVVPKGQHTNGGCRCLREIPTARRRAFQALFRAAKRVCIPQSGDEKEGM
jgi:hypothetical protein